MNGFAAGGEGVTAQRDFFREHGFVIVDAILEGEARVAPRLSPHNSTAQPLYTRFPYSFSSCCPKVTSGFCLIGEELRQAQAAYTAAMAGPMAAWEAAQRGGGRRAAEEWFYLEPRKDMYVSVPLDHAANPVLLEVLGSPRLGPVVQAIMVDQDDTDGYVMAGLAAGRAVPVFPEEDGYCSWHRDRLPLGEFPHRLPRGVKVAIGESSVILLTLSLHRC